MQPDLNEIVADIFSSSRKAQKKVKPKSSKKSIMSEGKNLLAILLDTCVDRTDSIDRRCHMLDVIAAVASHGKPNRNSGLQIKEVTLK